MGIEITEFKGIQLLKQFLLKSIKEYYIKYGENENELDKTYDQYIEELKICDINELSQIIINLHKSLLNGDEPNYNSGIFAIIKGKIIAKNDE